MSRALFDLTGRLALVTGSSQGIGYALAKGLAEAGARVVLNGRDAGKLAAAKAKLAAHGVATETAPFDVTDPAAPVARGSYVHPDVGVLDSFVHDLYVENGRAYLCYWQSGLVIVDTQPDPARPTLVGVFDAYERRTAHSTWVANVGGRPSIDWSASSTQR